MTTRRDTLADRIAQAQKEIGSWDSGLRASMQLQGAVDVKSMPCNPAKVSSCAQEANVEGMSTDNHQAKIVTT